MQVERGGGAVKNATKEGLAIESTGKSVEERVGTALGHRIRVEILALLNEGVRTADELAGFIGESRQTVHHHLKVLLREKSIEIARIERRRNANLYFYRAIDMASFDEETLRGHDLSRAPGDRRPDRPALHRRDHGGIGQAASSATTRRSSSPGTGSTSTSRVGASCPKNRSGSGSAPRRSRPNPPTAAQPAARRPPATSSPSGDSSEPARLPIRPPSANPDKSADSF